MCVDRSYICVRLRERARERGKREIFPQINLTNHVARAGDDLFFIGKDKKRLSVGRTTPLEDEVFIADRTGQFVAPCCILCVILQAESGAAKKKKKKHKKKKGKKKSNEIDSIEVDITTAPVSPTSTSTTTATTASTATITTAPASSTSKPPSTDVSGEAFTELVPCVTFVVLIPAHTVIYVAKFLRTPSGPEFYSFSFKHEV